MRYLRCGPGRAEQGSGRAATPPAPLLPLPSVEPARCSPRLGQVAAVREGSPGGGSHNSNPGYTTPAASRPPRRLLRPRPAPCRRQPIKEQNPPPPPVPAQSTRGGDRLAWPIRARPGETNRQRARRGFKNTRGRGARRRSAVMRRRCHGSRGAAAAAGQGHAMPERAVAGPTMNGHARSRWDAAPASAFPSQGLGP